jgi:hypothetical protein
MQKIENKKKVIEEEVRTKEKRRGKKL